MKKILILTFLLSWEISMQAIAQNPDKPFYTLDNILESIMDGLEDEVEATTVIEDLETYYANPLSINTASAEELKKLHMLNDFQIQQILTYRKKSGPILTIFELNTLEGFSKTILETIEPFVVFDLPYEEREYLPSRIPPRQQLMIRSIRTLQKQQGYKEEEGNTPAYEGSPWKLYARYRFQIKEKIQAGITAEKDAGESFFRGSNKYGFDYYSGHISLNLKSFVRTITAGDFTVQAGQGLVVWQGFARQKSTDPVGILKNPGGLRPYTSSDENNFFRGMGIRLERKKWNIHFFLSRKARDAHGEQKDNKTFFTSLQTSGYHRLENETADEKSVTETASGVVFSFRHNRLKLGATFLYQSFSYPFIRENQPYNRFRFSGKENLNGALDYCFIKGKYQLFGEAAISKSGGMAFLQGVLAHLHDQATFSFLFRHYARDYHALHGNAFSESSEPGNETGLYTGLKLLPFRKIKVSAYTDYYRFPWITYTTMSPSQGFDVLARIDYLLSENLRFYVRLKTEKKEVKITENPKYTHTDLLTRKFRIHMDYTLSRKIQFRTRIAYAFYKKTKPERGYMVYQDVILSPEKIPLKTQIRLAYIRTDSYNARIYAYENDLLYTYAMPAYFGRSIRTYINLKFNITNNWELWFKTANSYYPSNETIGSGYNQVTGQFLTEVKIQSRISF
jgi:hypothetical protein